MQHCVEALGWQAKSSDSSGLGVFWDASLFLEGDGDGTRNTRCEVEASHPPLSRHGELQHRGPCRQGSRRGFFIASQEQATCCLGKWGSVLVHQLILRCFPYRCTLACQLLYICLVLAAGSGGHSRDPRDGNFLAGMYSQGSEAIGSKAASPVAAEVEGAQGSTGVQPPPASIGDVCSVKIVAQSGVQECSSISGSFSTWHID